MKIIELIELIWAIRNGVRLRIKDEWYNYFVHSSKKAGGIEVFDEKNRYIHIGEVGSEVVYIDKEGRRLVYKIIKIRKRHGGDWLFSTDQYSVDLRFVRREK